MLGCFCGIENILIDHFQVTDDCQVLLCAFLIFQTSQGRNQFLGQKGFVSGLIFFQCADCTVQKDKGTWPGKAEGRRFGLTGREIFYGTSIIRIIIPESYIRAGSFRNIVQENISIPFFHYKFFCTDGLCAYAVPGRSAVLIQFHTVNPSGLEKSSGSGVETVRIVQAVI